MKISEIKITKLFGLNTYTIREEQLKENKLILVSENGGGKSTILKIIYYFLSKQWNELSKIDFEKIEVTIDGLKYFYNNKSIDLDKNKTNAIIAEESINKDLIINFFKNHNYKLNEIELNTEIFCLENDILDYELFSIIKKIKQKNETDFENIKILFLPTYRRTEKSFLEIHSDLSKIAKNFILDNFEVNLTEQYKNELENEFKDKNEFNEIELEKTQNKELENKLNDFFKDLWNDYEEIKKDKNISEISEFGTKDIEIIINEYIIKTEKIQLDKNFINFTNVCSKYLSETKNIKLENNELKLYLKNLKKEIKLNELSSGEKQIISLFAYLYLTDENYFIIFDEPELSISIFWQKTLLSDIENSNKTEGLLVATHSPYIFKVNNMQNVFTINDLK